MEVKKRNQTEYFNGGKEKKIKWNTATFLYYIYYKFKIDIGSCKYNLMNILLKKKRHHLSTKVWT